jgi:hypothetical protein
MTPPGAPAAQSSWIDDFRGMVFAGAFILTAFI